MPAVPEPVFRLVAPEETASAAAVRPRRSEARWWLGLMWGEWVTHARLLLFFLVAWPTAFLLIPLVAPPRWSRHLPIATPRD